MGCPVAKVCKRSAGAALLKDPSQAVKLAQAVVHAVHLPVTVKMRLGTRRNPRAALSLAPRLEEEGADALCLHPRTLEQGFEGAAEWNYIGELKALVQIPVIGNGDISTGDDARRMREETNCDAVMIGRGAIGNPWIFRQAQAALNEIPDAGEHKPDMAQRARLAIEHLEALISRKGEQRGIKEFRKHAMSYLKRCAHARQMRAQFFELDKREAIKEFLTWIPSP